MRFSPSHIISTLRAPCSSSMPTEKTLCVEHALELLRAYKAEYGHSLVPTKYVVGGVKLGTWVKCRRREYRHGRLKLCESTMAQLAAVGFDWNGMGWEALKRERAWEAAFKQLQAFKKAHGHCKVPPSYPKSAGVALGKWVIDQRQVFRGKKRGCLCPSRMARLDALEFVWSPSERVRDVRWVERALYRM